MATHADPLNRPDSLQRRNLIPVAVLATALIAAGVVWLILVFHPLPPRSITMVTGADGSAMSEFGKEYQKLLARDGVTLHLIPTAGAVENLARLNDPKSDVQLGFVEGGMTSASESPGLTSLGTLSYEPFWLFLRAAPTGLTLQDIRTKRLSIGPDGSGTQKMTLEFLKLNGVSASQMRLPHLTPEKAIEELKNRQIDGVAILDSWPSPVVQQLIRMDGIALFGFPRADAYVALFPFLNKLVLPMGVADMAKNLPSKDTSLMATKTNLVVRRDLHPALQYLLLEAASEIHSRTQMFERAGQFPSPESTDLPLSRVARNYYKSGEPFLQRYFPFWLAVLVEQILLLALPLVGVLYPIVNGLMSLYQWSMQRRIYVIYSELSALENQLFEAGGDDPSGHLLTRLDRLKKRADRIKVSNTYIPMLYTLRAHIEAVHEKLADSATKAESVS